jgi:hypothetical protein
MESLARATQPRVSRRSETLSAHDVRTRQRRARRVPAPTQTTRCWPSPFDELNRSWCWLARKDSNLRSPDPEDSRRYRCWSVRFERGADSDTVNPAGSQVEHAGPSQVNVIRPGNSGINRIGLNDRWEGEWFPPFPRLQDGLPVAPRLTSAGQPGARLPLSRCRTRFAVSCRTSRRPLTGHSRTTPCPDTFGECWRSPRLLPAKPPAAGAVATTRSCSHEVRAPRPRLMTGAAMAQSTSSSSKSGQAAMSTPWFSGDASVHQWGTCVPSARRPPASSAAATRASA